MEVQAEAMDLEAPPNRAVEQPNATSRSNLIRRQASLLETVVAASVQMVADAAPELWEEQFQLFPLSHTIHRDHLRRIYTDHSYNLGRNPARLPRTDLQDLRSKT